MKTNQRKTSQSKVRVTFVDETGLFTKKETRKIANDIAKSLEGNNYVKQ